MEKTEININKLKDKINKQILKIQKIKFKMDSEFNQYAFAAMEKDFEDSKKELILFNRELSKEIEDYKKERLAYKKSLVKVKDSLNEFLKLTKNNSKIKKNLYEINKSIINIDNYLGK